VRFHISFLLEIVQRGHYKVEWSSTTSRNQSTMKYAARFDWIPRYKIRSGQHPWSRCISQLLTWNHCEAHSLLTFSLWNKIYVKKGLEVKNPIHNIERKNCSLYSHFTPFVVSRVVSSAHLHLLGSWATRLLSQWMLQLVASQWQHPREPRPCTHPLTPNTRKNRPQGEFLKSLAWHFYFLLMKQIIGFIIKCLEFVSNSFSGR